MPLITLIVMLLALLLGACGQVEPPKNEAGQGLPVAAQAPKPAPAPHKQAFFGDLHVHTRYSFDAFIMGTLATPDDAYGFAKGGVLRHPGGFDMQLAEPLDFYAVTDHAFFLGALAAMTEEGASLYESDLAAAVRALSDEASRGAMFQNILDITAAQAATDLVNAQVHREAWDSIVQAANRHNDPGAFTTFIGYEYTASGDGFENLHRNVIFRGDAVPPLPFSRLDSTNPEDLWAWMDAQRAAGYESLAMPHNSNGSNGWMFSLADFAGQPLDRAYADLRMRNEPLVENSQIKGTSDTHPALSPNDEWADFEIMPVRIASTLPSQPSGSYVREALMNGLALQATRGFNPFKFGVLGSSDTHNASYAGAEDNYWGKTGILDDEGVERGAVPLAEPAEDGGEYLDTYRSAWSAGSLAGVWAEENTRSAIYDALRRKETFSTSGTRIRLRFFAGYDLPAPDAQDLIAAAYQGGVPMGADLVMEAGRQPAFLVWAAQDPGRAPLQRLQVIKAWVRNGEAHEAVFDVACANGGEVDPNSHRCPDNGARVNLQDCSITPDVGAPELIALWRDPDHNPSEHALYYARVLENPVCRWSTWDAIRSGAQPRKDLPATIQERAWSSPIWLAPNTG